MLETIRNYFDGNWSTFLAEIFLHFLLRHILSELIFAYLSFMNLGYNLLDLGGASGFLVLYKLLLLKCDIENNET